jgi:lysophospholipase L1-like esterase
MTRQSSVGILPVVCLIVFLCAASHSAASGWHFHFGGVSTPTGAAAVDAKDLYTTARGFGFEPGATVIDQQGCCTGDHPFYFSVAVPEGNYRVTVTLGDPDGESDNTVRAEARRLMVEHVATKKGELAQRTFMVNVRRPEISGGGAVKLRLQARSSVTWDDKLTLEFNGTRPAVDAIELQPSSDVITVFIASDSTVTDQEKEPYTGWGQMLPRFFDSTVSVANYAESGRALYSFRSEHRLDKILSQAKKQDYVLIQFGHNDQKDKRPGAGAFTTFKKDLEQYVEAIRKHDATPILVTPMYRRRFDAVGKLQETLGDYPAAVREVATEQNVTLIDLHAMSGMLFQTLGAQGTLKAFVHFPANTFPGQSEPLADNTHFTSYGAYELARCVVEGIRSSDLPLKQHLAGDIGPFDPAHPDPVGEWKLPASPLSPAETPEGN